MTTDKYDRMRALVLEHHAHQTLDPERSLQLRRSIGIPALPDVKTACSRRGIVPSLGSPRTERGTCQSTSDDGN
jgi:hypothetical protein